jgi:hypothetical protein
MSGNRTDRPRFLPAGTAERQTILTVMLGATAIALCGCAFSYTDANGDRHAIGLVDITVRAPAAPETLAGDIVEVTSLGLSIGQNAQGGYLTAGFNRQATAALRDNALVLGNPVTAFFASRNTEGETSK